MAKTKPKTEIKKLKKGDKIKINDEDYLIEGFNEEDSYDEDTGDNIASKNVLLSRSGKVSKELVKEKCFVKYNQGEKTIQLSKISEKSEKFKNGFSYEKSSSVISYEGQGHEEDLIEDSEQEINSDLEEEDW